MLKEGDQAPAFTVDSASGPVSLKDYKGKCVVLYFYPRDSTPGCTQEACDFGDALGRVKKSGAVVLGASRDSVDSHRKFAAKHQLSFPLLADEDGELCKSYGVWQQKSLYGRKFMGIVRTTFVISKKGKILRRFDKVKVKGHVSAVLEVLGSLSL